MDRPTHIDDMVPSYEFMLKHFRARPGLYILGAGASAGEAPFGENFMLGPALDYIPRGFPVDIPTHSELSQKSSPLPMVFPQRISFPRGLYA
jgi:hypothetical protein